MSNHNRTPAVPGKTRLRIRIIDFFGFPVANAQCTLMWGEGRPFINPPPTNSNGILEVDVPPPVTAGSLFVPISVGSDMEIEVKLKSFGRAFTAQGLKARLINLGYLPVSVAAGFTLDHTMSDEDRRALARFRTANDLVDSNGVPKGLTIVPFDPATTDRLEDAHDTDTGPLVK